MGPVLALDVQYVAETGGGDEGGPGAAALQHGIGGHGGAVYQEFDGLSRGACFVDDLGDAADQSAARIVGGAAHLVEEKIARVDVEEDEVGEGAAGVDGNAHGHGFRPGWSHRRRR